MSILDLTQKDVMRGVPVDPPGWYTVKITNVGEGVPSKAGDSTNISFDGEILKNADSGDTKFAGFPTPNWMFNSKAPGFAVGLLRACGENVEVGRVNLKVVEGKTLDVFIKQEEYQGRMVSKVDHQYRPTR
jgi:hypothetical protein